MNCIEFEKSVPDFCHQKMDFISTKQFMEHLRSCPNCKEELNIQFLIEEGLNRLEEGGALDLQKEIVELVRNADKKVHVHEKAMRIGKAIELLLCMGILAFVFGIILM